MLNSTVSKRGKFTILPSSASIELLKRREREKMEAFNFHPSIPTVPGVLLPALFVFLLHTPHSHRCPHFKEIQDPDDYTPFCLFTHYIGQKAMAHYFL